MTHMQALEWIGGFVYAMLTLYLLYRANKIMEEQNDIMREQGGAARRIANERTWWDKHWPMFVMAILTLATWSAVGYYYYDRHSTPALFEFDDARSAPLVFNYGQDAGSSCYMTINANAQRLIDLKSGYRLAIACFINNGTQDLLDVGNLQISQLYDIKDNPVNARVVYSDAFNQYRNTHGAVGINVALLVVPKGVDVSQFGTLRQARAMNVLIPSMATAIGGTMPH